ncbi:MAG: YceI family protein [Gammaproteobacteria bacterium]|nr:YceI family protein [Gammaproteobacteria bacterium]
MKKYLHHFLGITLLTLGAGAGLADDWRPVAAGSQVEFIAIQQGAKFRGRFASFDARISLSPESVEQGSIEATVETASVDSQNEERDDYLRGEDWFHVAEFPQAAFTSNAIRSDGEDLLAEGELTLRDMTRPVLFRFRFEPDEASDQATLVGDFEIRRLEFGVGRGLWENTEWVGDEVTIEVKLRLQHSTGTITTGSGVNVP